jgi:hypothetical protein
MGGARSSSYVKRIDRGLRKLQELATAIAERGAYVKAGFVGEKGAKNHEGTAALTNIELGMFHEFGTSYMPARPFLRPSFYAHRAQYKGMLSALVRKAVYTQKISFEQALGLIGQKMVADMRAFVIAQDPSWAPLAEETLRRKEALSRPGSQGGVKTLIDTGRMLNAISYEIVGG